MMSVTWSTWSFATSSLVSDIFLSFQVFLKASIAALSLEHCNIYMWWLRVTHSCNAGPGLRDTVSHPDLSLSRRLWRGSYCTGSLLCQHRCSNISPIHPWRAQRDADRRLIISLHNGWNLHKSLLARVIAPKLVHDNSHCTICNSTLMFTVCSDQVGCVTLHSQAIHLWRDTDLWQGSPARDTGTLWMFSWFPSTFILNAFYSTALFITCGWELSSNSLFTAASHYTELNTWTTLEIICFSGEHVPLFRGWIQPFMHEFTSIVLEKKVLYSHTHSHCWIILFFLSFLVFRCIFQFDKNAENAN